MKFMLFLMVFIGSLNIANASEKAPSLCDLSKSCGQLCDLKEKELYNGENAQHQAVALKCAVDLSKMELPSQ